MEVKKKMFVRPIFFIGRHPRQAMLMMAVSHIFHLSITISILFIHAWALQLKFGVK